MQLIGLAFLLTCVTGLPAKSDLKDQKAEETVGDDELNQSFQNTLLSGNEPAFKFPSLVNLHAPISDQDSAKIEPTFKETQYFDNLQSFYIKLANPKPVVDNIEEREKYGNDGQQHVAIGTAIVRSSEAISRIINKAIDAPTNLVKKLSRTTTDLLNQLGGKLIGLR